MSSDYRKWEYGCWAITTIALIAIGLLWPAFFWLSVLTIIAILSLAGAIACVFMRKVEEEEEYHSQQ